MTTSSTSSTKEGGPPRPASQGGEGSDLRERILDAATRLFAEHGYGSTSVRSVVEAVGCIKPALYYYFSSKEELFLEAVRAQLDALRALLQSALAERGTVRERLRRVIDAYVARVRRNPLAMRLLLTAQHRPEQGQPEVDLMSVHVENGRLLGRLLAEGVANGELRDDVEVADLTLALIGMVNIWALGCLHDRPMPDDVTDRILDLFFEGACARAVARPTKE